MANHAGMSRNPYQQFGGRGGVGTCIKKKVGSTANKMLTEGITRISLVKDRHLRLCVGRANQQIP